MNRIILFALLIVSNGVFAQQQAENNRERKPIFREVSNKTIVTSVYPDAVKVDKIDDFWYKIVDINDKTLGFAMSSVPFCQDVKGYNNVTPVMIITDKKWEIKKVALLSHWETLSYVRKLEKVGFFNQWDGKKLKEAKSVEIDGYSGATLTAKAVSKNVAFLLEKGTLKLPKAK